MKAFPRQKKKKNVHRVLFFTRIIQANADNCKSMNELSFSDQAMAELNKLSPLDQMPLVDALSTVSPEELRQNKSKYGAFSRDGKTYYRLREGDLRLYFTENNGEIRCSHILHKHSITDFAFRAKLPVKEEHLIEQDKNFWEYLDSLSK